MFQTTNQYIPRWSKSCLMVPHVQWFFSREKPQYSYSKAMAEKSQYLVKKKPLLGFASGTPKKEK